ncbi:MAG: type IX secretion system membrane protein PorP/SprF, partial [Flavobacteriales bacterium]|nr:type IX secretion system membrane protein PorP/SprF [Flavobacteriales bacterium]
MKNPIKCKWKTVIRMGVVLLFCSAKTLSAQDTQFSQQRLTPLLVNPAQTGVDHIYRAHFVYRSASLEPEALSVNSASASFDMRLGQNKRSPN